ncbi:uncharacterized protein [Ambystoma mexicanum]|uniref:uncharacterized protein isoform X2 n=1 Tax=Ambystoma mexicanum TaxID=8296 RepID=UPI0037E70987
MSDLFALKSHPPHEKYGKSEEEKKILFCEVCEVPCRTPVDLQDHFKGEGHRRKERTMMYGGFKVEELERIIQKIKCLKDYVDEENREPLVGLEYVVEYRHPGMSDLDYNCELCASTSKLVPMIVHLNGLKHRKAYIGKHFPFTAKYRDPNEDIFQFLRRMSSEIERYRGLRMFRVDPPIGNEPEDFTCDFPNSLKRKKRWDVEGCLSEVDPPISDEQGYAGEFPSSLKRKKRWDVAGSLSEAEYEHIEKLVKAKRAAEILQKIKPLNKEEARSMARAKALNKAAELMKPRFETRVKDERPPAPRGLYESDVRRNFMEHKSTTRDTRAAQQRETEEEWKKFFVGLSATENRKWAQPSNAQNKQSTAQEKRAEAEKRAIADRVAKAKKVAESITRDKGENRKWAQPSNAQNKQSTAQEKRAEAEKRAIADRVAKAKKVAESITRDKGGQKFPTTQSEQVQGTAEKDSTVIKVDAEKLAKAKQVAESITQRKLPLAKPGIGSFIGKMKSMVPNQPVRNARGTDPSVKQAIAEKLAQANRTPEAGKMHTSQGSFASGVGNWNCESLPRPAASGFNGLRIPENIPHSGMSLEKEDRWMSLVHERENGVFSTDSLKMETMPWRQAQTRLDPVATPCLPDDNVVDLLETFLKQSLGEEEQNTLHEGGSWNQEPLLQNQKQQYVTASSKWNFTPMAQNEQPELAVVKENWNTESLILREKVQRPGNPLFYDPPSPSFRSSGLNQLNYQTKGNPSSFLGGQFNSSNLRQLDSRGSGSLSGNHGFGNEFNQASKLSYSNTRNGGPLFSSKQLGTDLKANGIFGNTPSGIGSNRMTDTTANWNPQSKSTFLHW